MRSLMKILMFPLCVALARADDTVQAWYQTTLWHRLNSEWSVGSYFDLRLNDGFDDVHTWMISPRVRYDVNRYFQLQLNTSWLESENAEQTDRTDAFRLELEANPTIPLSDQFVFSMRNRFEWRWLDGYEQYNTRIRIRPQLDWILHKQGLFRGFFANNEVFWDLEKDDVTENRLTPFGIILRPADNLDLRLYYLWRHTSGKHEWIDYHALGVNATFTF